MKAGVVVLVNGFLQVIVQPGNDCHMRVIDAVLILAENANDHLCSPLRLLIARWEAAFADCQSQAASAASSRQADLQPATGWKSGPTGGQGNRRRPGQSARPLEWCPGRSVG